MRSALATLLAGTLGVTTAAATGASSATGRVGTTWRVSVASDGTQGNGDALGSSVSITPDARYVVFASAASNLVPGDTNGTPDVFRRDRATGRTQLVSVGMRGASGHCLPALCASGGWNPTISASGRYVAFESTYDNLVAGDTNAFPDVFVRDMVANVTTRVSVASKGAQSNSRSANAMISADGRTVVFASNATNLDPRTCDVDAESQAMCGTPVGPVLRANQWIFTRDLTLGKTTMVSVTSTGHLPDGSSDFPSVSSTGRYIAYESTSDNLAKNDRNNQCLAELGAGSPSCDDVFLYDRLTHRTELISANLDGDSANGGSDTPGSTPIISTDGRYVAFQSGAAGLVPNSHSYGVYLRDRKTHRTNKVSVFSDGQEMQAGDGYFALTPNGRFVVMDTAEPLTACAPTPNLVTRYDVYDGSFETEDRTDSSGRDAGCAYYHSYDPAITPDGRYVAFMSAGATLVRGDSNGKTDVFVRDRGVVTGVGGLAGNGPVTVTGAPAAGSDLIGAELRYRPQRHDLFVRLQVARMPLFAVASPSVVYALDFTAGAHRYELRAAKTGPTSASFGLFERTAAGWVFRAALTGGYGTTGQEVVAAVPIRALSTSPTVTVSRVTAASGIGSYATGVATVSDTIRLS